MIDNKTSSPFSKQHLLQQSEQSVMAGASKKEVKDEFNRHKAAVYAKYKISEKEGGINDKG